MKQPHIHGYRPDIDGLRAIAVLFVVVYHAFPTRLPGGFAGVDIFFVISGYLISSILFRQAQNNSLSFLTFYKNRFKRIFPSLVLMLYSLLGVGSFCLLLDEFSMLGKHVASGIGFVSNLSFYFEAGYFDQESVLKPLLHLWSLGIEEQFYLLFPLVVLCIWKFRLRLFPLLAVLFFLSFTSSLYATAVDPTGGYYLPYNRAWELLAGSLLAAIPYLPQQYTASFGQAVSSLEYRMPFLTMSRCKDILSVLGLVCVVVTVLVVRQKNFPGWQALLPVVGSVLLMLAGPTALVNRSLLSLRFMVAIGLISYPLYLWHWPLLSFARIIVGDFPPAIVRLFLVGLSIVLAALSYQFVEKSIRFQPTPRKLGTLGALSLALLGLGLSIYLGVVKPLSLYGVAGNIGRAANDWQPYTGFALQRPDKLVRYSEYEGTPTIIYFGDSNMEQYAPAVYRELKQNPGSPGAIFLTYGGILPIPGFSPVGDDVGKKFFETFWSIYLSEERKISTVVLGGSWFLALQAQPYLASLAVNGITLDTEGGRDNALAQLKQFIISLRERGTKVVLISNMPCGNEFDAKASLRRSLLPPFFSHEPGAGIDREAFLNKHKVAYEALRQIAHETGSEFIDPTEFVCPDGFCPTFDADGVPSYKDAVHFTSTFVSNKVMFLNSVILGK